jgi:hypothetical protein
MKQIRRDFRENKGYFTVQSPGKFREMMPETVLVHFTFYFQFLKIPTR